MQEVILRVTKSDEDIEQLARFLEPAFEVSYLPNTNEMRVTKREDKQEADEYDEYQRTLMRKCVLLAFRTHRIKDNQPIKTEIAQLINSTTMAFFEKRCQHLHYWEQEQQKKGVKK